MFRKTKISINFDVLSYFKA